LIAAFAQAETLFEEHPNLFVCTGRTIERGAVTWSIASFENPKSKPDIVTMSSLSYSVETTRTKLILRAIAAYENYERRKADEALKAASSTTTTTTTTTAPTTKKKSSSGSSRNSENDSSSSSSSDASKKAAKDSEFKKPAPLAVASAAPKVTVSFAETPKKSPRATISPRRINRTVTDRNLVEESHHADKSTSGSSHHHHRHHGRHGGTTKVPPSRASKPQDDKFMSLRESKGHGAQSVSAISPPPRKSVEPERERQVSLESRQSLASTVSTKKKVKISDTESESSSDDDDDENGSLESFLMTVLKKSSTHSNTVRGQVKLLFQEGVFTLSDLDTLLLHLNSDRWQRLSNTLDKRVVLACKTRAKVAAKSK